jgi:hypothetical protein
VRPLSRGGVETSDTEVAVERKVSRNPVFQGNIGCRE